MLDFRNWTFSSPNLRMLVILPHHSIFRLNMTIWSRIIAKMIFNMASVRHLEFGNFWNFLPFPSPGSKFASAYYISLYSDDSRQIYGDIAIFKMTSVRHVGFSDVIIMYRKTEFNALNIVLNFVLYRFHTFLYTSTVMFHHFSLKLPILP